MVVVVWLLCGVVVVVWCGCCCETFLNIVVGDPVLVGVAARVGGKGVRSEIERGWRWQWWRSCGGCVGNGGVGNGGVGNSGVGDGGVGNGGVSNGGVGENLHGSYMEGSIRDATSVRWLFFVKLLLTSVQIRVL